MALSTARIHRVRGRPPLLAAGITSLIHSHSSSVRSLGYIFSFIYPFYTTREDFSDRLLKIPCLVVEHRCEPEQEASLLNQGAEDSYTRLPEHTRTRASASVSVYECLALRFRLQGCSKPNNRLQPTPYSFRSYVAVRR